MLKHAFCRNKRTLRIGEIVPRSVIFYGKTPFRYLNTTGIIFLSSETFEQPLEMNGNNKNLISVVELKCLLVELEQKRPDICVRYRLLGEMWGINLLRVIHVSDRGALFNDEHNNKMINVSDLSSIMQFELDAPFMGFQPYFHYHVQAVHSENLVA